MKALTAFMVDDSVGDLGWYLVQARGGLILGVPAERGYSRDDELQNTRGHCRTPSGEGPCLGLWYR